MKACGLTFFLIPMLLAMSACNNEPDHRDDKNKGPAPSTQAKDEAPPKDNTKPGNGKGGSTPAPGKTDPNAPKAGDTTNKPADPNKTGATPKPGESKPGDGTKPDNGTVITKNDKGGTTAPAPKPGTPAATAPAAKDCGALSDDTALASIDKIRIKFLADQLLTSSQPDGGLAKLLFAGGQPISLEDAKRGATRFCAVGFALAGNRAELEALQAAVTKGDPAAPEFSVKIAAGTEVSLTSVPGPGDVNYNNPTTPITKGMVTSLECDGGRATVEILKQALGKIEVSRDPPLETGLRPVTGIIEGCDGAGSKTAPAPSAQ